MRHVVGPVASSSGVDPRRGPPGRPVGDSRGGKTVTGAVLAWGDIYVVDEIAILDSTSDTDSVLQDVREMGADIYQRQPSTFVRAHELAMVAETYHEEGDNDPVHALLPSHAGPTACSSSAPSS
ncbi:hypothetical protein BRC85_01085 [Halobacteriales archaeon QS_1_69_70]|nr:MAG: hypothetical protein BRC85_01085 [Halobacteriales archaeon QS_1_69_70]